MVLARQGLACFAYIVHLGLIVSNSSQGRIKCSFCPVCWIHYLLI
jgi:hypothetical protein